MRARPLRSSGTGSVWSHGSIRGCARATAVRWEGRLFIDIEREDPEGYAAWRRAGAEFRFPGGESLREQLDRVARRSTTSDKHGELPALVVCHGGSIRVMLCPRDPRGLDAFHEFDVPNVGGGSAVSRLPVVVVRRARRWRPWGRSSSPSTSR